MSLQSIRQRRWLVPAALLLALAVAGTALAKIARNTIDPTATIAANGRQLAVTGPISVTAGETAFIRVVVTQRSTGAVAEGIALLTGTGEIAQWKVRAVTLTRESFDEGPATAVALARTTLRGQATDAHQWLVDVTLIRN